MMGNQEVTAICGVTVSFRQGSFWAITGPSGSGKSTMLNLLGCLDRPTSGRYLLGNSDVSEMDDDALSNLRLNYLGFIFQSFNLIPQLTVKENIELPLYYLGWEVTKSSERARELAQMVGLEKRINHRPMELSGGEQQRVAIARALANDPSVLLADEPTGNLDSTTGEQIVSLLVDLNRRGKTVILVTHDPDTADIATNRMYLLDGRVERIEEDS
jgi:putative ABC transport system ATP-binding protein